MSPDQQLTNVTNSYSQVKKSAAKPFDFFTGDIHRRGYTVAEKTISSYLFILKFGGIIVGRIPSSRAKHIVALKEAYFQLFFEYVFLVQEDNNR